MKIRIKKKPQLLQLKTRIVLPKWGGLKGKIVGHTVQRLNLADGKQGQVYYLVRPDEPISALCDNEKLMITVLVLHPDNLLTLDQAKANLEKELDKNVYN